MAIESDGHSRGNPRIYELIENAPKTGKSPTIWAWPEVVDWLRVAGQPVAGPWPPHQQPRPNPEEESLPVAVVEPERRTERPQSTPPPARRSYEPPAHESPAHEPPTDESEDEFRPRRGLGLMDS
jgi:hypothetical protein